jgi:hypothetical protein
LELQKKKEEEALKIKEMMRKVDDEKVKKAEIDRLV